MNSRNEPTVAIQIFGIICFSLGFCCFIFSCVGYILSKKKSKKQNQIHFTNDQHASGVHTDIFTIDLDDTQSQNTIIFDPSDLHVSDKFPPTNEPNEQPLSG